LLKCLVVGLPEVQRPNFPEHDQTNMRTFIGNTEHNIWNQDHLPKSRAFCHHLMEKNTEEQFLCLEPKMCTHCSVILELTTHRPASWKPTLRQKVRRHVKFIAGGFWEETFSHWRAASNSLPSHDSWLTPTWEPCFFPFSLNVLDSKEKIPPIPLLLAFLRHLLQLSIHSLHLNAFLSLPLFRQLVHCDEDDKLSFPQQVSSSETVLIRN